MSRAEEQKIQKRSAATKITEMATKLNEVADQLGMVYGLQERDVVCAISLARKARLMASGINCKRCFLPVIQFIDNAARSTFQGRSFS